MTTNILRIGIMDDAAVRERTLAIAAGRLRPKADDPKIWFSSLRSLSALLDPNQDLLQLISKEDLSVSELAERLSRAQSNVSRTLKKMELMGLIRFEKGLRCKIPKPLFDQVEVVARFDEAPFKTAA